MYVNSNRVAAAKKSGTLSTVEYIALMHAMETRSQRARGPPDSEMSHLIVNMTEKLIVLLISEYRFLMNRLYGDTGDFSPGP